MLDGGECIKSVTLQYGLDGSTTIPLQIRYSDKVGERFISQADLVGAVKLLASQQFCLDKLGFEDDDDIHVAVVRLDPTVTERNVNDAITVEVIFGNGPDPSLDTYTFQFMYLIPGQTPLTLLKHSAVRLKVPRSAPNEAQSAAHLHLRQLIESPLFRSYLCDSSGEDLNVNPADCYFDVVEMDLTKGVAVISINRGSRALPQFS